jgi:Helicase HerA, central domain
VNPPEGKSDVILGWEVDALTEPQYWRDASAKPGAPEQENYLFRISADSIAAHTAIIAQSGSGKSFFLGRLVEEITLRTKSRCIILDPNADFKKIDEIEGDELWTKAKYDLRRRRGKLPHESTRAEFADVWSKFAIRVRGLGPKQGASYELLKLWLPSLSMDFLGGDLDPMLRSDLYHCHAFVQALDTLWELGSPTPLQHVDLFEEARKTLNRARKTSDEKLREQLTREFPEKADPMKGVFGNIFPKSVLEMFTGLRKKKIRDSIERVIAAPNYVSEAVERFYFGKIREYMAARIVETNTSARPSASSQARRIEVIDLPSLDKSTRLMAVNALLTAEWYLAREAWNAALQRPPESDTRVPTFVVVDEAHNLMPLEPQTKAETALREQFRMIVAEGRKYGLFLIVVSQRPDKLDTMILSECENRAIMRIGSRSVLELTTRMMGLEDLQPKLLQKSLEFGTGRILLAGSWSPDGPQIIYGAARRTVEGGRNLQSKHWATPATQEKKDGKTTT